MKLKHVRLFVKVPIIGRYCLVGTDLPKESVTIVQKAVESLNLLLHNVLQLDVTDRA